MSNRARDWYRQAQDDLLWVRDTLGSSARYPDAFPSGAPFEYFTSEQAQEAVGFAERAVEIGSGLNSGSDVDLVVVAETEMSFVERPRLFWDLRDRLPSLDLLVYTPAEFRRLTDDPSPGFWRSLVAGMRRIL